MLLIMFCLFYSENKLTITREKKKLVMERIICSKRKSNKFNMNLKLFVNWFFFSLIFHALILHTSILGSIQNIFILITLFMNSQFTTQAEGGCKEDGLLVKMFYCFFFVQVQGSGQEFHLQRGQVHFNFAKGTSNAKYLGISKKKK